MIDTMYYTLHIWKAQAGNEIDIRIYMTNNN